MSDSPPGTGPGPGPGPGPRPPSDPRLDEAVPIQEAASGPAEEDSQSEVEATAEVEQADESEAAATAEAETAFEPGSADTQPGADAEAPLRPFTHGRDAKYIRLDETRLSTVAGGPTRDPVARDDDVADPVAQDLVAPVRGGDGPRRTTDDYLPPVRRSASQRAADTGETVAVGASSASTSSAGPVTTLDVDLRPNNSGEPFRRFAVLVAALFLLIGVVLFREWSNNDSSETASSEGTSETTPETSSETTSDVTVEALVSTSDNDEVETEAGQSESDDTATTADSPTSTEQSDTSEDSETDDSAAVVSTPLVDPDGARGLLEADQVTLTGVVRSQAEADALVAQLENVVGGGNVDAQALTIDASVAPLEELTLSVPDELGFTPGSDTIEPSFLPVLDQLIGLFELLPSVVIAVEGHTDSSGLDYENLALSQRRAEAVVSYIVDAGVNSFRLEPQGRGSTLPIADNDTAAGRALNRRIEFIVFGLDLEAS